MHATRRSRLPLAAIALTGMLAACSDSIPLGPDLSDLDAVVAPAADVCPALTSANDEFDGPKGKKGGWGSLQPITTTTTTTSTSTSTSETETTSSTSTSTSGAMDKTASACVS